MQSGDVKMDNTAMVPKSHQAKHHTHTTMATKPTSITGSRETAFTSP